MSNATVSLRRTLAVSFLLVSGFGLGCGSGSGGGGGGDSIPFADFVSRAQDTLCDYEVRCGAFPDRETCEGVTFTMLQASADVQSGKAKYNGQAAASCLDGYAALGCNISDTANDGALAQTCASIVAGTVANGGACLINDECISQSCNLIGCNGAMCCSGSCQAQVATGGDCSATGSVCVQGTFCDRSAGATTATCKSWIAPGQPCSGGQTCAPGTVCNGDATTGAGTCGKAPTEGQACPNGICDSSADVCDQTAKTCVRRIAVGGACATGAGCLAYATCDAASKTCVALAAPGAACASSSDCLGSLPCNNGLCVPTPDQPACM